MDPLLAEIYCFSLLSMVDPETLTGDWTPSLTDESVLFENQMRLRVLLDEYASAIVGG